MKKIGIVMGSDSDLPIVEKATAVLEKFEKMYSPVMEDHIYRTGPGWVVQWSKPVTSNFSKEIIKIFEGGNNNGI